MLPFDNQKQRDWSIRVLLPKYDAYLTPARGDETAARVTVLLSHFFVVDLPPAAHAALLRDWLRALADLPLWAIDGACNRWIAERDRRPAPANIRALALEACADASRERDRLRQIIALPPPPNVLVGLLRGSLRPHEIKSWIEPLLVVVLSGPDGARAIVRAPTACARDWVAARYADAIQRALAVDEVVFLLSSDPDPEPAITPNPEGAASFIAEAAAALTAPCGAAP